MKKLLSFAFCARGLLLAIALIALSGPLPALGQGGGGGLTFNVYASPAPNRHGSGASLTAWSTWVSRALVSVESNRRNIGNPATDPGAFVIRNTFTPREFIVTSNHSWRAVANPTGALTNQQGNRMHFVLHVRGDGAVRFKIEDITWEYWGNGDWLLGLGRRSMAAEGERPAGYNAAFNRVDCTYGYAYDWGDDRAKGGGDDTKVCNDDDALVDELYYVGPGFAFAADSRYNKPDQYPQWAHLTLTDWLYSFCIFFNTFEETKQIGMKFNIAGSDDKNYEYIKKLNNPEYGQALDPTTCKPYPAEPVDETPPFAPTKKPKPPAYTGETLLGQGYQVSSTHGLRSGLQLERREAAAVGNQAVYDAGFIDAVDVWGYAEQGVEVCFPPDVGPGPLLFLDASQAPRSVSPLPSVLKSGMVCGTVHGPGMVVMVQSWPGAPAPAPAEIPEDIRTLSNCMVTATHLINFRASPGGEVIGGVAYDWTLTALARTGNWFKVDLHGEQGWVSADYVNPSGDCG